MIEHLFKIQVNIKILSINVLKLIIKIVEPNKDLRENDNRGKNQVDSSLANFKSQEEIVHSNNKIEQLVSNEINISESQKSTEKTTKKMKKDNQIDVTVYSAMSLINDLNVLRKRPSISNYNVNFRIVSSESLLNANVSIHSSILIARSLWFQRAFIKFKHEQAFEHFNVSANYANNIVIRKDTSKDANFFLSFQIENISMKIFNEFSK